MAKVYHVSYTNTFLEVRFISRSFFGFSACGKNEGQLPLSISSFKNEFAVFFRSSLKDNYKGLNCRYKVIPELLATTLEPQSSTPSSVSHNGDGNKIANNFE